MQGDITLSKDCLRWQLLENVAVEGKTLGQVRLESLW